MQAPPPPMMSAPMMMDRTKVMVAAAIAFGLLFVAAGAIIADIGNTTPRAGEDPALADSRADLRNVWGPAVAHFGAFLFVLGLLGAAVFMEQSDVFVRLFLLVLAFVALLLVLANSPTLFG